MNDQHPATPTEKCLHAGEIPQPSPNGSPGRTRPTLDPTVRWGRTSTFPRLRWTGALPWTRRRAAEWRRPTLDPTARPDAESGSRPTSEPTARQEPSSVAHRELWRTGCPPLDPTARSGVSRPTFRGRPISELCTLHSKLSTYESPPLRPLRPLREESPQESPSVSPFPPENDSPSRALDDSTPSPL